MVFGDFFTVYGLINSFWILFDGFCGIIDDFGNVLMVFGTF